MAKEKQIKKSNSIEEEIKEEQDEEKVEEKVFDATEYEKDPEEREE